MVRLLGSAAPRAVQAGPLGQMGCSYGTGSVRRARFARRRRAFTLAEMLAVVAIIGLLVSMLVPALKSARDQMRTLMCASNQRTIAMEFQLFADGGTPGGRGRSERLGRGQFWIDDFQAYLYRTGEFWDAAGATTVTMRAGKQLMLCPAGPKTLTKSSHKPFGAAAVGPPEYVSIGMNSRLYRAVEVNANGDHVLASKNETRIGPSVLSHPYVPLVFDVDGVQAAKRGVSPFYSAPGKSGADDPYATGQLWFPSRRHRGGTNVAFVGGHVQTSIQPAREPWDWEYQPAAR